MGSLMEFLSKKNNDPIIFILKLKGFASNNKMTMYRFIIFFIFFFSLAVYSQELNPEKKNRVSQVYKVLNHYQNQNSIVMDFNKKFSQPFLKKETESRGKFYFSKGLWRMELSSGQKTIMVYDGKQIIYKSNQDNVSHYMPSSQNNILPTLFDQNVFAQTFRYKNHTPKGRTFIYSFIGAPPAPTEISIQIEKDRILSLLIRLEEPLGEEYYRFSSIQFNKNLSKKLFQEP